MRHLVTFWNDDRGVDLIEYALLAGLVGVGAITFLGTFTTEVSGLYGRLATKLGTIAP